MSSSTAHAIDQAMSHTSEAKVKFVTLKISVEKKLPSQTVKIENISKSFRGGEALSCASKEAQGSDLEWVRVVLTADPGVRMEDIEDQGPARRKEHRRVPSTVAIEEVKVR